MYAGLFHEPIGDELEAFGIELVADRLALGHGSPHGLGALLELAPDPAGLDRRLVAIPGEAFYPYGCDVAAETAETFDERDLDAGSCCRKRGRQAARARADDQDLRFMHDIHVALRFENGLHRG